MLFIFRKVGQYKEEYGNKLQGGGGGEGGLASYFFNEGYSQ